MFSVKYEPNVVIYYQCLFKRTVPLFVKLHIALHQRKVVDEAIDEMLAEKVIRTSVVYSGGFTPKTGW